MIIYIQRIVLKMASSSFQIFVENIIKESKILNSEDLFNFTLNTCDKFLDEEIKIIPAFFIAIADSTENEVLISLKMPLSKVDNLLLSRLPIEIQKGIINILEKRIELIEVQTSSMAKILRKSNELVFLFEKKYYKTKIFSEGILKATEPVIYGAAKIFSDAHDILEKLEPNLEVVIKGQVAFNKLLIPLKKLGQRENVPVFKVEDAIINWKFLFKEVTIPENNIDETKQVLGKLVSINNENLITVNSYHVEGKRAFFLQNYVEGNTLPYNTKMDVRSALNICYSVGKGLQALHKKGLVHLDLKHDNIILNFQNRAIIIDLDTVKLLGSNSCKFTVGTSKYASPEVINPKKIADDRSDIFSLGVVIYELIYGEFPFEDAWTSVDRNGSPVINEKSREILPDRLKNSSNQIDLFLSKMLNPNIELRFKNIDCMLEDLKEILNNIQNVPFLDWHLNGTNTERILETANILWKELARIEQAKELFLKVTEDENNIEAFVQFGEMLYQCGKFEEAERIYEKSVSTNPNSSKLWVNLGHVRYDKLKKYKQAMEAYKHFRDLNPESFLGHLWIGDCYVKLEDPASAEFHFKKSFELSPYNEYTLVSYTSLLEKQNRIPEALNYIDGYLSKYRETPLLLERKAYILRKQDNEYEAAKIFTRIPNNMLSNNMMRDFEAGISFFRSKHYREAIYHLKNTQNMPDLFKDSLEMIIQSHFHLGSKEDYELSISSAEILLGKDPKNLIAISYKAESLLNLGKGQECINSLENMQEIFEANYNVHLTYISALINIGKTTEAEERINILLKNHENIDIFWFSFMYYLRKLNDIEKAENEIYRFMKNNRLKAEFLRIKASENFNRGKLSDAINDSKRSLEISSAEWQNYITLLKCYNKLNQPLEVFQIVSELPSNIELTKNISKELTSTMQALESEAVNLRDGYKYCIYFVAIEILIQTDTNIFQNAEQNSNPSKSNEQKLVLYFLSQFIKCENLLRMYFDSNNEDYLEKYGFLSVELIKTADVLENKFLRSMLLFLCYQYELLIHSYNKEIDTFSLNHLLEYVVEEGDLNKVCTDTTNNLNKILQIFYKLKVKSTCIIFLRVSQKWIKEHKELISKIRSLTKLNLKINDVSEESTVCDGIIAFYQGNYKEASELASIALEINPNNKRMLVNKFTAEYLLGNFENAYPPFQKYIKKSVESHIVYRGAISLLRKSGR